MFTKKDTVQSDMQKADNEAISSIIDKSMVISGEINFKGKAKIEGVVTGNINGEHLVLSPTGKVTGDINVTSFNCFGMLHGNVKANTITARKDCSIHGKLEAGSLTVESGAILDGEIKAALKDSSASQQRKDQSAQVVPLPSAVTANK